MFGTGVLAVLVSFLCAASAQAELFVERNVDIQGITPEGEFAGNLVAPDNESSCGMNPLMPRNLVCAWNASGGSDDVIGDTWIQIGETVHGDGGFQSRYMKGSKLDLTTWIGQEFMADPITLCWPGGCGVFALAANRVPGGGSGGDGAGIYAQMMPELNNDFGFRHALARELTPVYLSEPGMFADKLYATYVLNEDDPGTVHVTIPIDTPEGIKNLEYDWPKARIIVAFALGDPQGDEIRILSTFTDDYGASWSLPIEIASRGYWIDSRRTPNKCKKNPGNDECKELLPQGLNQGINISAAGDSVLYVYRTFEDAENPHAIQGRMSYDRGETVTNEVIDLVLPYCPYDVPTLPNSGVNSIAAARTSSFPWTSHNGDYRILVYTVRQPSSDLGCFTTFEAPTDSRVMAKVGSIDGLEWSDPVEIAPNPGHGFQFQANVDCTVGECLATWWDSRFDSSRAIDYLTTQSENPKKLDALEAFLNLPFLGDFNYRTSEDGDPLKVIQFRRTARVMATRIDISSGLPVPVDSPPVIVSKYRRALVDGAVREVQRDGWGIKGYRTSTVPFMGDYGWLEALGMRLVEGETTSSGGPVWEDNASFTPGKSPFWFASFSTSRNVVGQIYTARITDPVPYTKTPEPTMDNPSSDNRPTSVDEIQPDDQNETRSANAVEDFNPDADFCAPTGTLEPGTVLGLINNRTKDFDNFGAFIKDEVSVFTSNPTKSYNIPRSYNIVIENETVEPRTFRLNIPVQPIGAPDTARASFDQLPFDPAEFSGVPPATSEVVNVDKNSSETRPVFVVSAEAVNPVNVEIFEQLTDGGEQLVSTITLNGTVEDGAFLNEDGSINAFEIHNPRVYYPDEFAPDEFAPDEYAPDEFAPDLYTPDEFAASQFNPDEFAPDEFAPDEFAPDEFAPDEFAPDEFAPDEFAPDEFASPLRDEATLDNPEIPIPDLGSIEGLVVKKDINFALENIGNNTTGYTMDFEMVEPTIRDLIISGQLVVQVIAWQDKKITDVQFCVPRIISENRVIAASTDVDFTDLRIPDINNNSVGALTVVVVPNDLVQITIRFIAPRELMMTIYPLLTAANISSVFASMSANTGSRQLITDETLIYDNRTPPSFPDFLPIDSTTFEAEGPDGVFLEADFIQAVRDDDDVTVTCDPALPAQVGLDIHNSPPGPTPFSCTATTDNGASSSLQLDVFVLDTTAPTVDATSVADMTVEAAPGGTTVDYVLPTATDFNGVDPNPVVTCDYAPGDEFPFVAPGPTTTTVKCQAEDESMNKSELVDVFDVTIVDTSAPVIGDFDPPNFVPDDPRFVLNDDGIFALQWGPFSVTDAGATITVECTPGDYVDGPPSDPANGLYAFSHDFTVGPHVISCTATDGYQQSPPASFSIEVFDDTAPTITLLGDAEITIGLGETYVDPGVEVSDNSTPVGEIEVDINSSAIDNTVLGPYEVVITATDASGNSATASRTVTVGYTDGTGIRPTKLLVEQGSSNALFYGWLDQNGNLLNVRNDTQVMRIREGSCMGPVILQEASDKGKSGFRFKNDNEIQFNWEVEGQIGNLYCAEVESSTTLQKQYSPLMEIK
jgi:hypothetical protein